MENLLPEYEGTISKKARKRLDKIQADLYDIAHADKTPDAVSIILEAASELVASIESLVTGL